MDPVPMRIILAVVGALVGAVLGSEQSRFFDVLIGALTGFAVADLSYIRARLRDIEEDIDQLKRTLTAASKRRAAHASNWLLLSPSSAASNLNSSEIPNLTSRRDIATGNVKSVAESCASPNSKETSPPSL